MLFHVCLYMINYEIEQNAILKFNSRFVIRNIVIHSAYRMTTSNGSIFRVAGPLCREFTGHRRIPHTKASDAELWCFLWSAPE